MADMYSKAYTADEIRAAEQPLLRAQDSPDQLMKAAAHEVFRAAEAMLDAPSRVLLLVGKGGNGGDALYAGAELALAGHRVEAWLVFGSAHSPALEAFTNAGGSVTHSPEAPYALLIDGILGLGGAGSLPEELEGICGTAEKVLAVDVPSGVSADTGEAGTVHITADATVTFGGWRLAHALAPECGTALLSDISAGYGALSEQLSKVDPTLIARSTLPTDQWAEGSCPAGISALGPVRFGSLEPGARDDKYTGGVVGIRAGSGTYPGAAVLCASGAVAATSAMVRYAGPQAAEVVRAHPEVVAAPELEATGRVQAWVFGPGAGTDETATRELEWLLGREEPVLIDADGLTLLATHEHLRHLLREREAYTVLTPHDGETARLCKAAGVGESDRLTQAIELADQLKCTVLRKGRATIIALPNQSHGTVIDAGNSWAATPGSGDVLAGVAGARLARVAKRMGERADSTDRDAVARDELARAVQVHGLAAKLAAATRFGEAPTSASGIAAHIREATAALTYPAV